MKEGLLKILSYFTDISLEKTNSAYNPYLEVLLVNGRHQLITRNAIYSFDDKYQNFYDSFKSLNLNAFNDAEVLVLGLGLGSVIYMLEKNFEKRFHYTCVEIDPEIIRLANAYTLGKLESGVDIFQTDASNFVRQDTGSYNIILMDVFQNAEIPESFNKKEFLEMLKSKLSSNGLLLYNRMNITEKDKRRNEAFKSGFAEFFPRFTTLCIRDNMMFISDDNFLTS